MNRDLRSVRWMWRCAGFAAVATIGWLLYNMVGQWGPFFKADAMSTRGKSEMEARRIMKKPPKFVLTPVDVKRDGINAPWIGMEFSPVPTHPVHKRVLLYEEGWWAAYIFIDDEGRVEDVELAST